jgi:TadE-like protein
MKRRNDSRGQSLVEFALIFPIFILLLVSIFDLGHVVWANDSLSNAAREAARFAVVHGAADSVHCPQGPLPTTYGGTADSATTCGFTPSSLSPFVDSREGIKAQATGWLNGIGGTTTVSVCYGQVSSCSGDVDAPGATSARGTQITVTVRSTVGLAAPSLLGLGPFTLSGTSTMLVNN